LSDETQRGGRFGRRRGAGEPLPPAGTYDVAGAIEDNVRASVEEGVRRVLGSAPPTPSRSPGNGSPPEARAEPESRPPQAADPVETEEFAPVPPSRDEPSGARGDEPPARPAIAGPIEAFLRHPFVTLLPALLLVAGAIAIGVTRDPEYTAKARIVVGNSAVPSFYLQNVVIGNQQLAGTYARVIGAAPVVTRAAKQIGIPPAQAARDLSASPVASSTLIQVEGKGASERYTVALANAGADSLIRYVGRATGISGDARSLFREFKRAQGDARRAERQVQDLLKRSRRSSKELARRQLAEDTARLRASDLSNRYRAARSDAAQASRLTLIAPAAKADSDRRDVLEGMIALAAVGGLVLGLAVALLLTNWRVLRTLRPR
jgi:hypothetical protein